jgi:DNA-binding response OmpR family regulator
MDQETVPIGPFRLDLGRRVLLRDGKAVPLRSRPLEILCVLAAAKGNVVSKDELMTRAWSGAVVEENTIQVHVSAIRKALDEDASGRRYVVTVPGRGYRLAAAAGSARLRGRRAVPVVDDDAAVRETVRVVLEMGGYRVMTAADVDAALAAIEVVEPCVVLLDGDLPDAAGAELGERWRARSDRVAPIIVVAEAERVQRRCEDLGGAAYLPRPFRLDELYGIVGRLCGRLA